MAILPVIKYGHPMLRRKAEKCRANEISADFIADLVRTMYAEDGVGLAATQVDVGKMILVARDPEKDTLHVLVNPVITAMSEKMVNDMEGCLSLPKLQAEVPRAFRIEVKAMDPEGRNLYLKAKDIFARILQHEIDHLNGILYIDRANLSTLVWLVRDKSAETEEIKKIPTSLAEVQARYKDLYHRDRNQIVFQPQKSLKDRLAIHS